MCTAGEASAREPRRAGGGVGTAHPRPSGAPSGQRRTPLCSFSSVGEGCDQAWEFPGASHIQGATHAWVAETRKLGGGVLTEAGNPVRGPVLMHVLPLSEAGKGGPSRQDRTAGSERLDFTPTLPLGWPPGIRAQARPPLPPGGLVGWTTSLPSAAPPHRQEGGQEEGAYSPGRVSLLCVLPGLPWRGLESGRFLSVVALGTLRAEFWVHPDPEGRDHFGGSPAKVHLDSHSYMS